MSCANNLRTGRERAGRKCATYLDRLVNKSGLVCVSMQKRWEPLLLFGFICRELPARLSLNRSHGVRSVSMFPFPAAHGAVMLTHTTDATKLSLLSPQVGCMNAGRMHLENGLGHGLGIDELIAENIAKVFEG